MSELFIFRVYHGNDGEGNGAGGGGGGGVTVHGQVGYSDPDVILCKY